MKNDSLSQKNTTRPTHHLPHLTRNQQAVLAVLRQQSDALSAQELYGVLREQQAIGLATVYRALETLKLQGLVQSRSGTNGEALHSPIEQDRHYLTCLHCGQSFLLDHCPVHDLAVQVHLSVPFKIYYHTLEFFGLCEPCTHQRS